MYIVHVHPAGGTPVLQDKIDPHTIDKSSRRGKKGVLDKKAKKGCGVVAQSPYTAHTQQARLTDCNFVAAAAAQ